MLNFGASKPRVNGGARAPGVLTVTAPDRCFYLVEPGLLHNIYNRSEKGEDQ